MKILSVYQACAVDAPPHDLYSVGLDGRTIALFEAAEDLLRELEHLVRLLEPFEDDLNVPGIATLNGARAAIAKARGNSHD